MSTSLSPNMSLPVPGVGSEAGPDYAIDVNACLAILDQHDHSAGSGVQITPDGLNINASLDMDVNYLINTAGVTFAAQSSPPANNTIYQDDEDLYFVDGLGNNVRITASGAVAGTPGSIANLVAPASASYVSASSTFVWQSNTNIAASLDFGSAIFRNQSPNSTYGITVQAPAALSSNYSITLPALPASTELMTITSSGTIASTTTAALTPSGVISAYGGTVAPSGYILCDGSAVSRSTYAALFTAISTAYGNGNGTTTFNVPDLRGMFLRGVTGASSNDPDASGRTASGSGGATGNNVGSKQTSAMLTHTHTATASSHSHNQTAQNGSFPYGTGSGTITLGTPAGAVAGTPPVTDTVTITVVNTNAGSSTETRPINVYVNYIIKT